MIPLRDENPRSSTPIVNIGIIAINCIFFLIEASLDQHDLEKLLHTFGLVPAELLDNLSAATILSIFTSMFLHAGWLHLLGNMWILWIFGDNIEDRLGHFRYFLFYLFCGVLSGLVQVAINPESTIPQVGASGAIAGVLGAYLILFPHARVLTIIPFFYMLRFIHVPAVVYLGIWIISQGFSGIASLGSQTNDNGGIAWWAHIGGFILGAILIKLLRVSATAEKSGRNKFDRYY